MQEVLFNKRKIRLVLFNDSYLISKKGKFIDMGRWDLTQVFAGYAAPCERPYGVSLTAMQARQ